MQGLRSLQLAGVAVLVVFCACGDAEEPRPSGPPMKRELALDKANQPPVIQRVVLDPPEPTPGAKLRALVSSRDPDGDPVSLTFAWSVGGRPSPQDGEVLDVPDAGRGEPIEVTVTPSDGRADGEPAGARTQIGNRRPVLASIEIEPRGEVVVGEPVVVHAEASDPDGDPVTLRFRWTVNGRVEDETLDRFSTRGLRKDDVVQVRVEAYDGRDASDPRDLAPVRVTGARNQPPVIVSAPQPAAGGRFVYRVEAEDPEGDLNLRYRLRKAPDGMAIDPALGEIAWQPRPDQVGVHDVEVIVEDSAGAARLQSFQVTVADPTDASAPADASAPRDASAAAAPAPPP